MSKQSMWQFGKVRGAPPMQIPHKGPHRKDPKLSQRPERHDMQGLQPGVQPDGRHLAAVVDNVCTVYDMEVLPISIYLYIYTSIYLYIYRST